jgi:hypothetical protein
VPDGKAADSYLYEDLTNVSDYTIQSGDVLEYEVYLPSPYQRAGVDLVSSDGVRLSDFTLASRTVLLLNMDGPDASVIFTDSSKRARTVSVFDNAQIDTAWSYSGGASGLFDGAGDCLTIPDCADWTLDCDFHLDFRARFNALPAASAYMTFIGQYVDGNNRWGLRVYNNAGTYQWVFYVLIGAVLQVHMIENSNPNLAINAWYRARLTRSGITWTILQDDTSITTTNSIGPTPDLASVLYIAQRGDATQYFNGWLDAFQYDRTMPSAAMDQNGLLADPATDISNYAHKAWYHRKIIIPESMVGKVIQKFDLADETDTVGDWVAGFRDIYITDGAGTIRKTIYDGDTASITVSTDISANTTLTSLAAGDPELGIIADFEFKDWMSAAQASTYGKVKLLESRDPATFIQINLPPDIRLTQGQSIPVFDRAQVGDGILYSIRNVLAPRARTEITLKVSE